MDKQRMAQKTLAISSRLIKASMLEAQANMAKTTAESFSLLAAARAIRWEAESVIRTPASLFRKDKPEIDSRRLRKANNTHKGATQTEQRQNPFYNTILQHHFTTSIKKGLTH